MPGRVGRTDRRKATEQHIDALEGQPADPTNFGKEQGIHRSTAGYWIHKVRPGYPMRRSGGSTKGQERQALAQDPSLLDENWRVLAERHHVGRATVFKAKRDARKAHPER